MMYTIEYNGFHGFRRARVRGTLAAAPAMVGGGRAVEVSARVARRLNALVCGCEGCTCGEALAVNDEIGGTGRWWAHVGEIAGYYPQR